MDCGKQVANFWSNLQPDDFYPGDEGCRFLQISANLHGIKFHEIISFYFSFHPLVMILCYDGWFANTGEIGCLIFQLK
jgi:hypothetical protein